MITLQVEHLCRKYNRQTIFEQLSFEHTSGVLGIAGANGSGKSTLLKCLSYLLRPNEGSIKWRKGENLLDRVEVKGLIGYSAPYISLYTELTVWENLKFIVEAGGKSFQEHNGEWLLEKVQIPKLRSKPFGKLSTGQQQRAKIASALVTNPEILILDEPGSNLDIKGQELVSRVVQEASEAGTLVILASNDPDEIALCDQVVELNAGNG